MLHIAGGYYREICLFPYWNETYGSGGRAIAALSKITNAITFHTYASTRDINSLKFFATDQRIAELNFIESEDPILFHYMHSMAIPYIVPTPEDIRRDNPPLQVAGDVVLRFGMLEGEAIVKGRRVVYDPQSPKYATSYFANRSTAEELAIICNLSEAKKLTNLEKIDEIGFSLLSSGASVCVIKNGVFGALLFTSGKRSNIPAYKTNFVTKLGSGDIFTAIFAYMWGELEYSPQYAAQQASMAVAEYCGSQILPIQEVGRNLQNKWKHLSIIGSPSVLKGKKIYIAAPFFGVGQRWLVEEAVRCLREFGLSVFSPIEAVGIGLDEMVAKGDLKGIDNSDLIFSILEEMDSGSVFELGYAVAKNIPIIVYTSKSPDSHEFTMLRGTKCEIVDDFGSAIYRTVWRAMEICQ